MRSRIRFILTVLVPLALCAGCDFPQQSGQAGRPEPKPDGPAPAGQPPAAKAGSGRTPPTPEVPYDAALSADGRFAVVAFGNKWGGGPPGSRSYVMWDVKSGEELWQLTQEKMETGPVRFLGDGKTFVAGGGGKLRLCVTNTGAVARELEGGDKCARLDASADGKTLVAAQDDGDLLVVDVDSGKVLHTIRGVGGPYQYLIASADGKYAFTYVNGTQKPSALNLWDLSEGKLLHGFPRAEGWDGPAAFSPDGKRILVGREDSKHTDGRFVVLDFPGLNEVRTLPAICSRFGPVVFSSDGKALLSTSDADRQLTCSDASTGKIIWSAKVEEVGSQYGLWRVAFSEDRSGALTCTVKSPGFVRSHPRVKVWDATDGTLVRVLSK